MTEGEGGRIALQLECRRRLEQLKAEQFHLLSKARDYEKSLKAAEEIQKDMRKLQVSQKDELREIEACMMEFGRRPLWSRVVGRRAGLEGVPSSDADGSTVWAISNGEEMSIADISDACHEELKEVKRSAKETAQSVQCYDAAFLRMFLGNIPIILPSLSARIAYKKDTHDFLFRFYLLNLVLTVVTLIFPFRVFISLENLFWIYFYVSLSLRDHVLKLNGSNIIAWWMWHHILSIGLTAILELWPFTPAFLMFWSYFRWFGLYNGIISFVTHWYQQQKLYIMISTEQAGVMDSVHSRAIMKRLAFVSPFLIVGHIWQIFVAVVCFRIVAIYNPSFGTLMFLREWQALVLGLLFFILGFGNALTLFYGYLFPLVRKFVWKTSGTNRNGLEG